MTNRQSEGPIAMTAIAVALLVGAITLVCVAPLSPGGTGYTAGERAPRTLEAIHAAQFESPSLTEAARKEARQSVDPVTLPPDSALRSLQVERVTRFYTQVRQLRQRNLPSQQALSEFAGIPGAEGLSASSRSTLLLLASSAFDDSQARAERAVAEIMDRGVLSESVEKEGDNVVRDVPSIAEIVDAYLRVPANAPTVSAEATALGEVLKTFVVPNKNIDEAETEKKRTEAEANVAPVVVSFTRGQVVITEGQTLSEQDIEALRATGLLSDRFDFYGFAAGAIVAAGMALLTGYFLYQDRNLGTQVQRRAFLSAGVICVALASIRGTVPWVLPDSSQHYLLYALPLAAAAMIVSAFTDLTFGAVVAMGIGLVSAFIAASAPDIAGAAFIGSLESLQIASFFCVTGLVGAVMVHRVERLSRYALTAVVVAVAGMAVLGAFWMTDVSRDTEQLGWMALAAGGSGFGATIIAAGVFVVLSAILGIPTRLQLMELTDSSHPIQRRLREEAPGTYHHSMLVGALAERAADRIGADSLLARVGAYYHDTGKLSSPAFYVENMLDGRTSPHDALTPPESAEIIRNHVTAGLALARRHRLPPAVRAFIPEHHGTRLVTYFYRKAVEAGAEVDPTAFRYGGPIPQSRETAIVMLADSCEALARAQQGNAEEMDAVVDSVIAERLAEGQLDDCDITMRELQSVAQSFKATLRAVYHPRIAYPSPVPEEVVALATGRPLP